MVRNTCVALIVMVHFMCESSRSEDLSALGLKSNQASKRDAGSAARLTGPCLIYQVFVSDQTSGWSREKKAEVARNVTSSLAFIVQCSKRFGADVSFPEVTAADFLFAGIVPTSTFGDPKWTEEVIQGVAKSSANNLVARLKKDQKVDNVLLCLHVNRQALSYNLAHYSNIDETYFAERMVCFTRYPDGRPTAAATYAHEILHLFGAGDLYFPYDKDGARKELARRFFPDDIMRRVDYDMTRLTIGAFTAYRIGWLDQLRSEYHVFED